MLGDTPRTNVNRQYYVRIADESLLSEEHLTNLKLIRTYYGYTRN